MRCHDAVPQSQRSTIVHVHRTRKLAWGIKQKPHPSSRCTGLKRLVGTGRFELPTPRTPSECSTRLSHVPNGINNLQGFPPIFDYSLRRILQWAFLSLFANGNFCQTSHRQRLSGTSTASNG